MVSGRRNGRQSAWLDAGPVCDDLLTKEQQGNHGSTESRTPARGSKCEIGSLHPGGDLLCQRAVVGIYLAHLGGNVGAGLLIVSVAGAAQRPGGSLWTSGHGVGQG